MNISSNKGGKIAFCGVFYITMSKKYYFKAEIFGMCGGVHTALNTLQELVDRAGQGVFVFNELVHNRSVTDSFIRQGVSFVNKIEDVPQGAPLVIGAHGVAPELETALRARAGECVDATCPLVKKLHRIAAGLGKEEELILFGKAGHPEVAGVAGYSAAGKLFIISSADEVDSLPDLRNPVFISQTTVDHGEVNAALEKLKQRFPQLKECSNICDASWKRQIAVLELAKKCDAVLVIGSLHSSNARRLMEIARRTGIEAALIDDASQITPEMLSFDCIGITSGASTPQYLFDGVVSALEKAGFAEAEKEADS